VLVDVGGLVKATAAANFLIVREGVVISPPFSSILNGISLNVVRQLCDELKIPFETEFLDFEACLTASEVILTNTSFCLAGVSRINDARLTWPGPVMQQLVSAWSQKVGLDIVQQIRQSM
jgi:branched-subunit amino acid aminotransferase/4-amino-4-deoxychorismate lyase